jgi:hypothetical protein
MPTGQPIGLLHLVDEAAEGAENVVSVVQNRGHAHAHVVNAETPLTHALAQSKADAHFVKDECIINNINDSNH